MQGIFYTHITSVICTYIVFSTVVGTNKMHCTHYACTDRQLEKKHTFSEVEKVYTKAEGSL